MKCPIDGSELVMTERQGIEIDYCPQCRGIWLDRGELEKLIERANGVGAQVSAKTQELAPRAPAQLGQGRSKGGGSAPQPTQNEKSLLKDLFGFFG